MEAVLLGIRKSSKGWELDMPKQGADQKLYTYAEITKAKDKTQEERDNLRIASIKRDIQNNNLKSAHDKLASYDQWILLRITTKAPEIMALCKRPEMSDIWQKGLAHFKGYFDLPLKDTSLFDLYIGHFIFNEFYQPYEAKNLQDTPAAQELMEEACKRLAYPALSWRCIDAIEKLRTRNDQLDQIQKYLGYADKIASSHYHCIGYLEAAHLYFDIGDYLVAQLNSLPRITFFSHSKLNTNDSYHINVFGRSFQAIYAKAFEYLAHAQLSFALPESQKALQVAFCKDNVTSQELFNHFKLPESVQDFDDVKEYFLIRCKKYLANKIQTILRDTSSLSPAA